MLTSAKDAYVEAPVARGESYGAHVDVILTVGSRQGVLANDGDPEGDALVARLAEPTGSGRVVFDGDG